MALEIPHNKTVDVDVLKTALEAATGQELRIIREPRTETIKEPDGSETVNYYGYQFDFAQPGNEWPDVSSVIAAHSPSKSTYEQREEARIAAKYSDLADSAVIKSILDRLEALEGK